MAIPDFQKVMLPALRDVSKHDVSSAKEIIDFIAREFKLSPTEREELLPSGQQPIIDNRVLWALSYLFKAGLIMRPSRGRYSITELGKKTLSSNPDKIDIKFLMQFDAFKQFRSLRHAGSAAVEDKTKDSREDSQIDPREELERSYVDLRASVIDELLRIVRALDPTEFEYLVIELLKKMGYGVPGLESVVHRGKSGDGGIDGEISQDPLGLDMIYLQAKRYQENTPVGRPSIQQFVGSLNERKAKKGIFITTSYFTAEAKDSISRVDVKIVLIDGIKLAELMFDHNLGVETEQSYDVKKINADFFQS